MPPRRAAPGSTAALGASGRSARAGRPARAPSAQGRRGPKRASAARTLGPLGHPLATRGPLEPMGLREPCVLETRDRQVALHVPKRSLGPERGAPRPSRSPGNSGARDVERISGMPRAIPHPRTDASTFQKSALSRVPHRGERSFGDVTRNSTSLAARRGGPFGLVARWTHPDSRSIRGVRRPFGPGTAAAPRGTGFPRGKLGHPNKSSCRTVPSGRASMPRSRSALASSSANPWWVSTSEAPVAFA